jgi:ATP-dependent exoDNAse (exonuclease V) beta subunit
MEAFINGTNPSNYIPPVNLFKNLTEEDTRIIKEYCIKMCHQFEKNDIGLQTFECIKKQLFYKAEYGFRMFMDNSIFTGSIDLIIQTGPDTYKIIDYKTDQIINTEKYLGQQKCYQQAASKILNIPPENIELCLYFLRFDEAISL